MEKGRKMLNQQDRNKLADKIKNYPGALCKNNWQTSDGAVCLATLVALETGYNREDVPQPITQQRMDRDLYDQRVVKMREHLISILGPNAMELVMINNYIASPIKAGAAFIRNPPTPRPVRINYGGEY